MPVDPKILCTVRIHEYSFVAVWQAISGRSFLDSAHFLGGGGSRLVKEKKHLASGTTVRLLHAPDVLCYLNSVVFWLKHHCTVLHPVTVTKNQLIMKITYILSEG